MDRRDRGLDAAKGFAILAVVVIHAVELARRGVPMDGPAVTLHQLARIADHLCRFAVPWFMAVLGVLTVRRHLGALDVATFVRSRWRRIVLPFLLWSLAYEAFAAAPPGAPASPVVRVLLGYSAPHLYFVPAYLGWLLVLPVLRPLLRDRDRRVSAAALAIGAHLLLLQHVAGSGFSVERGDPLVRFYLWSEARLPLHWLAFFFAGVLLETFRAPIASAVRSLGPARWPAAALSALTWLGLSLHALDGAWDWFWLTPQMAFVALAAALTVRLLWPSMAAGAVAGALAWLGRRSYPVFLAHVLALVALSRARGLDVGDSPQSLVLAWACALAFGVLWSWPHAVIFDAAPGRGPSAQGAPRGA